MRTLQCRNFGSIYAFSSQYHFSLWYKDEYTLCILSAQRDTIVEYLLKTSVDIVLNAKIQIRL